MTFLWTPGVKWLSHTARKISKFGVFSGPYSVQIRENTDQKKLRIWTLFTHCQILYCSNVFTRGAFRTLCISMLFAKIVKSRLQFSPKSSTAGFLRNVLNAPLFTIHFEHLFLFASCSKTL